METNWQKFWQRVNKTESCWIWTGAKDNDGYGHFNSGQKIVKAHRHLWESMHGPIQKEQKLRLLCGNASCVNPDHMEALTAKQRFEAKIKKTEDCWEWTAARDKDGYGFFSKEGKQLKAHRAAWEFERGAIPDGIQVLHKCDNPKCVRVDHLFLGTNIDNVKDRTQKRRQPEGEKHSDAKVTLKQVQEMRRIGKIGTYKTIANKYGISIAQTAKILNRQSWKND